MSSSNVYFSDILYLVIYVQFVYFCHLSAWFAQKCLHKWFAGGKYAQTGEEFNQLFCPNGGVLDGICESDVDWLWPGRYLLINLMIKGKCRKGKWTIYAFYLVLPRNAKLSCLEYNNIWHGADAESSLMKKGCASHHINNFFLTHYTLSLFIFIAAGILYIYAAFWLW